MFFVCFNILFLASYCLWRHLLHIIHPQFVCCQYWQVGTKEYRKVQRILNVTIVFLQLIVFCFQILCYCERAPSLSGVVSTFTSSSIKYSTLLSEPQNILENCCDDTFGLDNWNQHWVCLSILWNLHNRICWRYSLGQPKKMWVWGIRSNHNNITYSKVFLNPSQIMCTVLFLV